MQEKVNNFHGNGIKNQGSNQLQASLANIKRDYKDLLRWLISKLQIAKCTIYVAYGEPISLDLFLDSAGIKDYLKKRLTENVDLRAIVNMAKNNISPAVYVELQWCQPTSFAVECSLSTLRKLLTTKDRQFLSNSYYYYSSVLSFDRSICS